MRKSPNFQSLVFILGCQRSGTTWLANIFDASPDTLLFVEPFSPRYGIFPEFPETSAFLDNGDPELNNLLRVEMPKRLLRYKRLLFSRSMEDPRWFRFERWVAGKGRRLSSGRLGKRIRKFELLNLNRLDKTYTIYPKSPAPCAWIIKELRLAGKIKALLNAFPGARFVVIIRHPCATVHSMLSWFERGSLIELQDDMNRYIEKIAKQNISASYRELINLCEKGGIEHHLSLYWRISYETMLNNLRGHPFTQVVVYEQLAAKPKETVMQVFSQLALPWTHSLDEYISTSTTREVEKPGPIDTRRKSGNYYKKWMTEIPESLRQTVLGITEDSFLMNYFEPYY
jgi:hypothetical protein